MIENVIASLWKTADPNLPNDERRQHFHILNTFQNDFYQLDDLKTLLNPVVNEQAKIFGLKCLEHYILYKWNEADKNKTKSYLMEIIQQYQSINVNNDSERVMRWIIAKSVVYFIRHECPQNYSTFIVDLIGLKSYGTMTQAVILAVLYCLSETLPGDSQAPEKRKKEVVSYIIDNFECIMDFCLEIVSNPVDSQSVLINLRSEAIITIQSLCGWIKHDMLLSMTDRIFTVLIPSLIVDKSDSAIIETIETIFERKGRPEDRTTTLLLLITNQRNLEHLLSVIEFGLKLDINPYNDDKFRYLQQIFNLILSIGSIIVTNWQRFYSGATITFIDRFFDIVHLATHHPVRILAIEVLSFWYNGLNTKEDQLLKYLTSKAAHLLPLLKHYSIKQNIRHPSNNDHEYVINLVEQCDEDSYNNKIRFETSQTISTLIKYFTQDLVSICMDMVSTVIWKMEDNGNIGQLSHCESEIMKELEASKFFTRCVMHNIFRPYSKDIQDQIKNVFTTYSEEILSKATNIIMNILASDNSNVHVVSLYADLLCLLFPFASSHEIVRKCLEKVFIWFSMFESLDPNCPQYMQWRQLNKNCGVWILRIFRDFDFLITSSLFENIFGYYKSICNKLYEHPIIVEAMTIYICHSSNYELQRQQEILSLFISDIKEVILSDSCVSIFENGDSIINYLQMNSPIPIDKSDSEYPSHSHQIFRNQIIKALVCLSGISLRISSPEADSNATYSNSPEAIAIIASPLKDYAMPLLPSLLRIIRALNQIWSSHNLHADFSNLKQVPDFYRDTLVKNNQGEKCHSNNMQPFAQRYVNICKNFIIRLHEANLYILSKYCLNFSGYLYSLNDWPKSIVEYVFADVDSLPNFKLSNLIKSFLIPFVTYCPMNHYLDVVSYAIIPFINYMFERLHSQWSVSKTENLMECADFDMCFEEAETDGDTELCNEIIEEHILRTLSKNFCDLFRLTMSLGVSASHDANKGFKLGIITEKLFEPSAHNNAPMMLVLLSNLCRSLVWKDSMCCLRLSQVIQSMVQETSSRGYLNIDIIIYILQQSIAALNLFVGETHSDIRNNFLNLMIYLYDEYIVNDFHCMDKFINLLCKSDEESIRKFRTKMAVKSAVKVRRENFLTLLHPYIGVPINQLFSQQLFIKDFPSVAKPDWKGKRNIKKEMEAEEVFCLEDLFRS